MTRQELDVVREAIVAGVKAGLEAVVINPSPEERPEHSVTAARLKPEDPRLKAAGDKIEMVVRSILGKIQSGR